MNDDFVVITTTTSGTALTPHKPFIPLQWYTAPLGDIKITGTYDDGATIMPDIGGSVCHLCGKLTKFKNTYQRYNKKVNWVTRTYLTYACGTEVFTNEKGVKKVTLGSKCIKPPVS